ncbi:flagellar filament capping protein FliD [Anaerovibrio slackiae]|uniref:flagellar filament capping protein FliD n=1 Tax=Anaerovibrio slackiae TaxID=2652309 RepID=UPI00386E21C7
MGANGIYGLSGSGLDIESLVKMGMMNKQNQYDKMYQNEMKQEWLKEAYVEVYDSMKTFKNNMTDFKMQSNMSAMKATTTNEDVVSVTANGAAAAMSHKVSVSQVASNAYIMTGMKVDGSGNKVPATIDFASDANPGKNYLMDVLYSSVDTIDNGDGTYSYKLNGSSTSVNGSDVAIKLTLKDSSASNAKTHEVTLTYDDIIQDKKTLSDLASTINNSGANIQAGFDTANGSFSLYNKTSGEKNIIGITAGNSDTATLLNNLHLASYNAQDNTLGSELSFANGHAVEAAKGTNAKATIDGKTYDLESNKITVAGVTYNFNNVSEVGRTTTVNVSQDTDKIVDNVKKFVDMYNTLLDSLNDKLSEEKYSDYKPLTKEQEKDMSEDQIKKWNEKAKSGLLYHNNEVRSLVSDMREAIYTPVDAVDSKYNSLSAIGITTTTTKGHITLDEDKLRKALTEDPDCVYQLFASDQDSSYIAGSTNTNKLTAYEKKDDYKNTGVANRLYNAMTENMSIFEDYAGTSKATDDQSYLGKLITNMQTKMTSFQTLMKSYENKLYDKYDAMEVALSKLGTQLSYITG